MLDFNTIESSIIWYFLIKLLTRSSTTTGVFNDIASNALRETPVFCKHVINFHNYLPVRNSSVRESSSILDINCTGAGANVAYLQSWSIGRRWLFAEQWANQFSQSDKRFDPFQIHFYKSLKQWIPNKNSGDKHSAVFFVGMTKGYLVSKH